MQEEKLSRLAIVSVVFGAFSHQTPAVFYQVRAFSVHPALLLGSFFPSSVCFFTVPQDVEWMASEVLRPLQ